MKHHLTFILLSLLLINIAAVSTVNGQDNYYWVGGQGKWSEISHWATTSGGTVIHVEVPDGSDNVIFDQNSFLADSDTIFLDAADNVCRDFIWTDLQYKPVFTGADTISLRIFGSMKLDTNMVFWYSGITQFEDTLGGKTVNSGGLRFYNDVYFNGDDGEWTLQSDLWVEDTIDFTFKKIVYNAGSLKTNNYTVTTEGFFSFKTTDRLLDISYSDIIILGTWQVVGENLLVVADSSQIWCSEFFTNIDGEYLQFFDITFNGPYCGLLSNNIRTSHNNVRFKTSGIVDGTITIDSLIMMGNGQDSCIVSGTDTINYAEFRFVSRVSGEYHYIQKLVGNTGVTVAFKGLLNHVDSAFFHGKSYVLGTNEFDYLLFDTEGYVDGTNLLHETVFSSDGEIFGQNIFGNLTLTGGYTYVLERDSANTHIYKQIINKDIFVQGACEGGVAMLTSDVNTVRALIECPNGALTTEYLALRDIRIIGDGPFIANNSIDLGNNLGWTINELSARDLYWVDGQGTWDDRNHWSLSSGGAGGECPPTLLDNAYFDKNSFSNLNDTVFVNVKYASCHDMEWTGATQNPVFLVDGFANPDTNNLRIYGSLTLIPDMSQEFRGRLFFESEEEGETVNSAGHDFYHDIYFRGRGGGWTLLDTLITEDTIKFHYGTLNTNDQIVGAAKFDSQDTTTRMLILGNSEITLTAFGNDPFTGNAIDAWIVMGPGFEMDAGSSTIISTATYQNNGHVTSFNTGKLFYHNIEMYGLRGQLRSFGEYCSYNLVDIYGDEAESLGPCTIDSLTLNGAFDAVRDSDTINVALCKGFADTIAGGNHVIRKAHFFERGVTYGGNKIDTLYYDKYGIIQMLNQIDTCVFRGNGEIAGKNTFGKLTFTKGKKYTFKHDSTQVITHRWTANGDCTGSIIIQSDLPGRECYIRMVNGQVELDYVSLRDMHALGQVPFKAINSVDVGNNNNWDITQPAPLGLYWVNGTGTWDDPYHWAAYSGGPGNYCVPKEIDHVYFDENSFFKIGDTVNINVDNAVCKSMYWQGSEIWEPFFFGMDTTTLTVYGSLFLNETMTNQYHGHLVFEELGASKNSKAVTDTIHTYGKAFNTPLPPPAVSMPTNTYFQGINNKWVLQSTFTTINVAVLTHGHLELSGDTLRCGQFLSVNENPRILDISNSVVEMNRDFYDGWYLDATNVLLYAGNSTLISNGFLGCIKNENGDYLKFHNIVANNISIDVHNYYNDIEYHDIVFNGDNGSVDGNFKLNQVEFYGKSGAIRSTSETNTALFYGTDGRIEGNHVVNTAIYYARGTVFGSNYVKNCTFFNDGNLLGINTFDTLTFSPGGTYIMQTNQDQTIHDVLNIRGNNCYSLYVKSTTPGVRARFYMEEGVVAGDFLELQDIAATGGAAYYAGQNSLLTNSTGWLDDNAPGYIYGFPEEVTRFCLGTEYIIETDNFNANVFSKFYWEGSTEPGDPYLPITEPGTYHLTIDYGDNCLWSDSITLEADYPPVLTLDTGPYCEGEAVGYEVYPRKPHYKYAWSTGSEDPNIYATLDISGNVWVEVTDTVTGCIVTDERVIDVLETPKPELHIGNDTILPFGYTILLNAGPGDTYLWENDDPLLEIENPENQTIEAKGTQTGIEYFVEVTLAGCKGSGSIYIDEYPRCAADVPDAFTPNGDGVNDVLYVRGNGLVDLEFMVFDRYGLMVFQTHDITEGWDGLNAGSKHEMEVFTYYMKAICADGGLVEKKGNITLMR
ncbi:MAG: gliding motility-associated C-terminal domain-containing protein [Bacteroidales bacterium]|nr:gliding motility-associated C-terminal domain-containing protein [Bacteroidales bacterium]